METTSATSTPSRWGRMWDLFHAGRERSTSGRAAWLAAACAGEDDLRRELEDLFVAEAELGTAVERPPYTSWDVAPDRDDVAPDTDDVAFSPLPLAGLAGARLGPYRVLRELGSGGMGVVVLAERDDGELEQRVAIKVLPRATPRGEEMWRFRQERQILARLDHPHVARLLDAGTTAEGRPYFVMEHVDGEPIDVYCRRRGLGVEERVALVRAVCAAVHAAHQNLVVHRDLKPGNILVTPDGTPKLLDFGIAKLLAPAPAEAPRTVGGWRPMTPEYASPEQVRGEPVTTASDVYSLGVLLYELLTGRHPTAPAATPGTPLPSPRLGRDLDTILAMAMHPEPGRRYGSAAALADDLGRHLAGLPVRARKDTFAYRAGKLVRRRPWATATAFLAVLLLAGFTAAMTVQSARLARERARVEAERAEAVRERERAERVSAFLVELFRVSNPSRARGETITARELLDRGAERLAGGLEDEPEVRARLLRTVGKVYEALGLYRESTAHLERRLAEVRRLHAAPHPDVAEGLSDLAIAAQKRGDYPAAEALHREALAMRRRLLGDDAPEVADGLNAMAVMLHAAGEYERAEDAFREASAIRRRAYGEESWQVSQVDGNLGWLLHDRGRFEEAEALYRRALATNRRLFGERHRWVAKSLSNLALLAHDRGDLDVAERGYAEALAVDLALLGEERHPELAIHYQNQGRLAHDRGDLDRAEALYRRALAIRETALPPEHPATATSLVGLGRLLVDRGDAVAAEPLLRRALAVRSAGLAAGNWHVAEAESLLGGCLLAQGRRTEAAALLTGSLPAIEASRGTRDLRARQARSRVEALPAGSAP